MADNIFDAQRDRRIQHLQQQSVSNIVRSNPNLRGVLSRYEDAEVSRIKLLELQRLRSKKISKGELALIKAVAKSRGRRSGGRVGRGGKKVKVKRRIPDYSGPLAPDGTPLTTKEVEVEEFVGKDQQIGEGGSTDPIDPELERDKLRLEQVKLNQEREIAREDRQERARLALEDRRQRGQLAARERGQRQIQFEEQARLEDRRVALQQSQIDAGVETEALRQQAELARVAADIDKYNAEARRAEANRDRDIAIADRQLADLRERVARDDAFRHAELQKQQQLAIEQLAVQRQENTQRVLLEQNRIDNQRAVDAERAITDRELIQTLQSSLDALNRFQVPQDLPEGRGNVEETDTPPAEPARAPQTSSTDESLGGGGGLALVEATDSDLSSADTLAAAPPNIQRLASIQAGRETPRQQERRFERRAIDDPTQEGVPTPGALRESPQAPERFAQPADEEVVANRLRGQRRVAPPTQPEPELALSESSGSDIGSVPSEFERILRESPPAGLRTQEEQVGVGQRAAGAVVGGLQTAGAAAGGLVGGVAQGIAQQLPAASDVGAAVGRGGVRLVGGIVSGIGQGLRGTPQPGEQTGGRLDPRGEVVGLGREIESPERQP